ncbi:MAG: SGNH/GDSL hydrolase family protein [Candidatus Neomarinimicrobiota bacterium]
MFFISLACYFLIIYHLNNDVRFLISGSPLILFGILLYTIELLVITQNFLNYKLGNNIIHWEAGGAFTKNLFPKSYPFIGPGGRLKPNLNSQLSSPSTKKGVKIITNSKGFRNQKEIIEKEVNHLRILNLGDSFSIGYGIDQNRFFGPRIKTHIKKKFPNVDVEVINAEVSDPAYGAWYYKKYGHKYKADIVVFGLATNDILQSGIFYGQNDRFMLSNQGDLIANEAFNPDTSINYFKLYESFKYTEKRARLESKKKLLVGWVYSLSKFYLIRTASNLTKKYIYKESEINTNNYSESFEKEDPYKRMIDGSHNLGFFYKKSNSHIEEFYKDFFDLILYMNEKVQENNGTFILFIHPYRYQVNEQDWTKLSKTWNLNKDDFDLRLRNRRISEFCKKNKIKFVDIVDHFEINSNQLYLTKDVHYNNRGHNLAAKMLVEYLKGDPLIKSKYYPFK